MDNEQISVIPHELLLKLCIGMRHVSCTSMHWLYAKKLLTLLTVQGIKVFTVFDDGKFLTLQNEYTTDQFYNVMNTLKLTIFSHLSFNQTTFCFSSIRFRNCQTKIIYRKKQKLLLPKFFEKLPISCHLKNAHSPLFCITAKSNKG